MRFKKFQKPKDSLIVFFRLPTTDQLHEDADFRPTLPNATEAGSVTVVVPTKKLA